MFTIDVDEAAGVVHLALTGFWTPDTVRELAAALLPAIGRLRKRHGRYAVLSDSTAFPVQSAEVSAAFARFMAGGEGPAGGRTAIVVASVLNKLQAQRVFTSPHIGVFLTRDEALAWLGAAPAIA